MGTERLAKAVAKQLQQYLDKQRREESFDLSGTCTSPDREPRGRSLSLDDCEDLPSCFVKEPQVGKSRKNISSMKGLEGLSEREKAIRKQIERSMLAQAQKKRNRSPYAIPPYRIRVGSASAEDHPRSRRRRRRSGGLAVGRPPSSARRSPGQVVSKEERDRILSIATKLIVATETVALPQNRRIAKGNQTDSEVAFPNLQKDSRRQSSASDPGPRNLPHPPSTPSRSSAGRAYSARSSPWAKSGWGDNLPSGSGTESHDEIQTQMQKLRIHAKENGSYVLAPRGTSRPPSTVHSSRSLKSSTRGDKMVNGGNATKTDSEIQTEPRRTHANVDNNEYEDDFYDHSSTEVSPMSTPRNIWSPSMSVQTQDIATQTVVHTGTQTLTENNADYPFKEKVVFYRASSSPMDVSTRNEHEDDGQGQREGTAAVKSTHVTVQTKPFDGQETGTETAVPIETQTRRKDLEPTVITYEIYVATGDRLGASTNADVRLTLFGEYGDSGERALLRSRSNKTPFQRKQIDVFAVDSMFVGKLNNIRIGHSGTALGTGWFLDSVYVKEGPDATRAFEFVCGRWLSARDDDGQIIRDLPLTRIIPAIDLPSPGVGQQDRSSHQYQRLASEIDRSKRPLSGQPSATRNSVSERIQQRPQTAGIQRQSLQGSNGLRNKERDSRALLFSDGKSEGTREPRKSRQELLPRLKTPSTYESAAKSEPQGLSGFSSSEDEEEDSGTGGVILASKVQEPESRIRTVEGEGKGQVEQEGEDHDEENDQTDEEDEEDEDGDRKLAEDEKSMSIEKEASRPLASPVERKVSASSSSSSSSSDSEEEKEQLVGEGKEETKPEDNRVEESGLHVQEDTPQVAEESEGRQDETDDKVTVQMRANETITLSNGNHNSSHEQPRDMSKTSRSDSSEDEKIEFSNKDTSKKEISSGRNTPDEDFMAGFKAGIKASREATKANEKDHGDNTTTNAQPSNTGESIHRVCEEGDLDKVKSMIVSSPELKNQADERGWSPIHITAAKGHLALMKWLSVSGVDLMKETPTGYTPMHLAAMNGHVNCIMVLAAMGCSISCRTVDKFTPLHLAAMSGHLECVKWLLANRARYDVLDIHGRTPYDLADEYQHEGCASLLASMKKEYRKKDSIIKLLRNPVDPPSPRQSGSGENEDGSESWVSDTEDDASGVDSRPSSGKAGSHRSSRQEKVEQEKEEKRVLYQKQREKLKKRDSSFLDSVRMDVDQAVEDDF